MDKKNDAASVVGSIKVSDEITNFGLEDQKKEELEKIKAHPQARKLAQDNQVDLTQITPSDRSGIISLEDVQSYLNENSFLARFKNLEVEVKPLSNLNKTMFKRMVESKTKIPHATMFIEVDANKLVELRKKTKEKLTVKVTYLTFLIKAVSLALKEVPIFNSSVSPDFKVIYKKNHNIGFAMDSPRGLIVPVIKDVQELNIEAIATHQQTLINNITQGNIKMDQISDSTFTITNFGSFGASFGVPVINYPESAILGLGKLSQKPVFTPSGEIQSSWVLPLSLAFDHRHIDGGLASKFVKKIINLLNEEIEQLV